MPEQKRIEMDHVTIVVPVGSGKKVLELAKLKGITGGTVNVGIGTANKELLEKLEDKNLHRDVVSLVTATDLAEIFLKELSSKFSLGKPGHGIAWATNVNDVYTDAINNVDDENREKADIQVITAIIKNGTADIIMDAARSAGARGGTVLEPSDIDSGTNIFSKESNEVYDVVIIIARKDTVEPIMEAINFANKDKTKAVVYLQDAHFVYGLK